MTAKLNVIYIPKGAAGEYAGLAFNPWIGCKHGCLYCYGPEQFNKTREEYLVPVLRKDIMGKLERDLKLIGDGVPLLSKCGNELIEVSQSANRRVFIMFGGDLYSPPDNEHLMRKILEAFKRNNVSFDVLTKAGTDAFMDFDLYFKGCRFGVTLTFDNDADSLKWEPEAALPKNRIDALRIAHEIYGIKTWVSMEPVIDPAQTLHLISLTHEFVDFYWIGKLNHYPEIENATNWHKFRADAMALLEKYGKDYSIKRALLTTAPR